MLAAAFSFLALPIIRGRSLPSVVALALVKERAIPSVMDLGRMKERAARSLMNPSLMKERVACSLTKLGRMAERVARSLVKPGLMKQRVARSAMKAQSPFVQARFTKQRAARCFVRYGHRRANAAHQRFCRRHFRTRDARAAAIVMPARRRDDAPARFAMPDFIARKDSDLVNWSNAFCDGISQYAPELNIPPEKVTQLLAERDAFRAAYWRACSPARNMGDTRAKNDARKRFVRSARALAGMARATATSLQCIEMGIKPRRRGKAPPNPRPKTAPVVNIISVAGRIFHLHISDATGGPRPHGVHCALVYWFAGESPPPDLRQGWCLPTLVPRRKHALEIPAHVAPGTKVWVSAQWLSTSKLLGPSSPPIFQYVGWGMGRIAGLKAA